MAKKEFFSSFEENLSLKESSNTTTADNTNITATTSITKKAKSKPKATPTKVTTFRIKTDVLEKIHAIAYWDREKIQDVLDKALTNYIDNIPAKELEKAMKAYKK
jgi:uncharacterized protein (DUF4415 family)